MFPIYIFTHLMMSLLMPSTWVILVWCVAVVLLFTRFVMWGKRLALFGAFLYLLFGFSPLGTHLIAILEDRFSRPSLEHIQPKGIIILGGSHNTFISRFRPDSEVNLTANRLTVVPELVKKFPQAQLIFTGGEGKAYKIGVAEADLAEKNFKSFGLDTSKIIFERQSENTFENALFTARLVEPQPQDVYLLVTSGFHMPRAVGTFRQAGFQVVAYPVNYFSTGTLADWWPEFILSDGLRTMDFVAKEFIGMVVYYFRGRTDALFPSPLNGKKS